MATEDARRVVAQYLLSHGVPPADNTQAGMRSPDEIHGHYVSSVEVSNGTIVASFGSQAAQALQNRRAKTKKATLARGLFAASQRIGYLPSFNAMAGMPAAASRCLADSRSVAERNGPRRTR